jgi:hypothetical protein
MLSEELQKLAAQNASNSRFHGSKDVVSGKYDTGGTPYPKAAVSTGNVLLVKTRAGYKALIGKRGAHLAHGGKLGLLGGYVDLEKGESIAEGAIREVREETSDLIDIAHVTPIPLGPYLDFTDKHNNVCCSNGFMYKLDASLSQIVLDKIIRKGEGINKEVSEFQLIDIKNIDSEIQRLGGTKAFGYIQDVIYLLRANQNLYPEKSPSRLQRGD